MPANQQQDAGVSKFPTVFPPEFEKQFREYIDKRFVGILTSSLLIHMLVVMLFAFNPPPAELTEQEIDLIQKRFANLILDREEVKPEPAVVPPPKPKKEKEPEKAPAKKKDSPKKPVKKTTAAKKPAKPKKKRTAPRRSTAQIKKEARSQGILGLLSSTGSASRGKEVRDMLGKGVPKGNLEKSLSSVSGIRRAQAGDDAAGRAVRGKRKTEGGGIDNLVATLGESEAGGVSRSGELQVEAARPLLENGEDAASGGRDIDAVSAIVQAHNAAIQYCYQRELKRNPSLKGKIVIRFSITPMGTVKDVEIVSSTLKNRRVENCVVSRVRRWNNFGAVDPSKGNTTIRQVYTFGF